MTGVATPFTSFAIPPTAPELVVAIQIFAALTGLRPFEWIALERGDLDGDVLHVRRVFTDGRLKPFGNRRDPYEPFRCLRESPRSFASCRRAWTPGCYSRPEGDAATSTFRTGGDGTGIKLSAQLRYSTRSPYALHHTYASLAIAAGISLFELSRFMGTSVSQLDQTYGHLLPYALDRTRSAPQYAWA